MDNRSLIRFKTIGIGILVVSLFASCTNRTIPPEVYYTAPTAQAPDEIKDLLLESSVEDLDGVEPSVNEDTEEELFIPDEYYELIDSIVFFIDNYDPNDDETVFGYYGEVFEMCYYDNTKDIVAFAFLDIDGDNVAELAILDCTDNSGYHNRIIEFYTYYDNQVQYVFSGNYRNRYYLSKDLYFYSESSAGAAYSDISKSEYNAEMHKLSFCEVYFTYPIDEEWGDIGYYYASDLSCFNEDGPDLSKVEDMGEFSDSFNLYGTFGVQESDFYDFSDMTTLTEYCESKEG